MEEQLVEFISFYRNHPIGAAAMLMQIVYICDALRSQVQVLRKMKRSDQMTLRRELNVIAPILLWSAHGIFEAQNWCIVAPQIFGLITVIMISGHVCWYRRFPGGYKTEGSKSSTRIGKMVSILISFLS